MPSRSPGAARHRVHVVVIALAAAVSSFAVTTGVAPTDAAWVVTRTMNVSATAVTPTPPTALTCGAGTGGLFSAVPMTWTAPTGPAPSGYTLSWSGAATGSVTTASTNGSVPTSALAGTLTVRVLANYGTSWSSLNGTQTRTITIIAFGTLWSCG